jgi:glycosyltransferase involved in cell wall biosynthesis
LDNHITVAVIPAHNKGLLIGKTVHEVRAYVDHVIVVDNGSHDQTFTIAQAAGADCIRLDDRTGAVNAIIEGLNAALRADAACTIVLNARGLDDPHNIPYIIRPVIDGSTDLLLIAKDLDHDVPVPSSLLNGRAAIDFSTPHNGGTALYNAQKGICIMGRPAMEYIVAHQNGETAMSAILEKLVSDNFRLNGVRLARFTTNGNGDGPDSIPQTIAVIAAYNEELCIGSTVLRTQAYVDRVIVVDDGSTDATTAVAKAAGAEVITLPRNQGKAHALVAGLQEIKKTDCKAAVLIDADGQHNPDEIPKVLAPVLAGEADLVIGSRFLDQESDIPAYRVTGQVVLNVFTNLSAGQKVTDSQSGFRAVSCKALGHFDFCSDGYSIESDMIAHFAEQGLKIAEVPITVRYDVPNKHKKNAFAHGFDVLGRIVGFIGYRRPLIFFGIPGFSLFMVGLIAGSFAFSQYYMTQTFHYVVTMISGVALVLGLLLITSGLILNSLIMAFKSERIKGGPE